MKRRTFVLAACWLAFAAPLVAAPPNVLLIVADDHRGDAVGALGDGQALTPNLDALVQRGFVFRHAYCMGSTIPAVCAPSRTMLMTGRSLWRIPDPRAPSYAGPTLGGVLRKAGFDTLFVGKKGNSFVVGNDAFETVVYHDHASAEERPGASAFMADRALAWLAARRQRGDARPFCMYLGPQVPHDPRVAPPEFMNLYDPAKISLPKSFLPRHSFDNGELSVRDELLAPIPRKPADMQRHLAEYFACISALDFSVGRVLAKLRDSGQLENTLVIYTSDQGLAVGGCHGLMGKQNLYEHVKPPLIVAGPGIPRGSSDSLAYLFDVFPTICEACQIAIPAECEGASLLPVARGETPRVRESLLGAYRDCQRMIRDERWKLIAYRAKTERNVQLFDLENDPHELHNLAADPRHAAQRQRLTAMLAAARAKYGDPVDFDAPAER